MAPEVFTRNNTEGHGRAADIWSVGCVVVEMSSGRVRSRSGFDWFAIFALFNCFSFQIPPTATVASV